MRQVRMSDLWEVEDTHTHTVTALKTSAELNLGSRSRRHRQAHRHSRHCHLGTRQRAIVHSLTHSDPSRAEKMRYHRCRTPRPTGKAHHIRRSLARRRTSVAIPAKGCGARQARVMHQGSPQKEKATEERAVPVRSAATRTKKANHRMAHRSQPSTTAIATATTRTTGQCPVLQKTTTVTQELQPTSANDPAQHHTPPRLSSARRRSRHRLAGASTDPLTLSAHLPPVMAHSQILSGLRACSRRPRTTCTSTAILSSTMFSTLLLLVRGSGRRTCSALLTQHRRRNRSLLYLSGRFRVLYSLAKQKRKTSRRHQLPSRV